MARDSSIFWVHALLTAIALVSAVGGQLMTSDEKTAALQFINYLRRNTLPRAADMNALVWDANLESLAQQAANTCVFAHNYNGPYATLGEILYRGGSRNMTRILMLNFLERENYNYTTGHCNTQGKYTMFNTCSHYLQVATANVNKVGCGVQLCGPNYLAACEFDRQFTAPPYQTGQPGTKCGNSHATSTKDGLCYHVDYFGNPPPPGVVYDCKLTCLNLGTLVGPPFCMCTSCPSGVSGLRCQDRSASCTLVNNCTTQAVTCKNGGTPTMFDATCKCVCPPNFRGESCDETIDQTANSIFLYFGGEAIYQSYYPVDVNQWAATGLRSKVEKNLTQEVNNYCRANFAACCPNPGQPPVDPLVAASDFYDTDNYPFQDMDGALIAGVYYRLNPTLAMSCRGSATAYITRDVLTAAWTVAEPKVRLGAVDSGLTLVRTKLT